MKLFIERKVRPHVPPILRTINYEFIDLSSSGKIPKNLINKTHVGYNTITINNNDKSKELFEIFEYLYENGGIYIQKLNCSPDIFRKNNEMVVYNIHYFSCIKKSPIMKKILDELKTNELNIGNIQNVFDKHTRSKNIFKFNKSLSLLL